MPSKTTTSKESLVVSGISGRFPECLNLNEFRTRILRGDSLITFDDARWPKGTYNVPPGTGKMRQIEDFDAEFFGYTDAQADMMDPLDRLMIAEVHRAILDAGVMPSSLRGTNTGFFWGSFVDEVQSALKDEFDAKASIWQHHASRIHEAFDLRGPSCWLENGCATSLTALQIAVNSIENGQCDQALVGGVNITMDPTKVKWQQHFETLSSDSLCRVFDAKASGYVKSEACVVILVQKRSKAKRIYAEILGTHVNVDGYKDLGFTHPGWKTQRDLMFAVMAKANISGRDYRYFEAHGTGTQAGDKCETRSIYEAICRDRTEPLMVGSIKSITGHTEGASGLVSLAKIIIAYQVRLMAPNIYYETPNPAIPQLTDGTFQVYTKAVPFEGGICGINNFGIGGGNSSLVINSYDKPESSEDFDICSPIPRLVLIYGRNLTLVQDTLDDLEAQTEKLTRGYFALLNEISSFDPHSGMSSRGFLVLDEKKQCVATDVDDVLVGENRQRRPLWFVFNGIGSQWSAMAAGLMEVAPFRNSIYRSIKFLTALGYDPDILSGFIISGESVARYDQPVFVSITVIQIALYESLISVGVRPDGIVGHSVGEVAAAFADGCITRDEALRIVFTIEREVVRMRSFVPGQMVAVGLSMAEALKHRFGTIDVACDNSPHMVTMAGNKADMKLLCERLRAKQVFVHEVDTAELTTHTRFLRTSFEPMFMQQFEQLASAPRSRSTRFVSSSFSENEWSTTELCRKPGSCYFGRNMLNLVRFREAIQKAPKHTLFLELGPTGQLKSPIAQCFDADHNIRYTEMMRRDHPANAVLFLKSLGVLYNAGHNLNIANLYPKVEYPVSRYTPFISPLLRYDHSKPRFVTKYPKYFCPSATTRSVYQETISLATDPYLGDHSVDGMPLYPGTGYLYLAWRTIASYHGAEHLNFPVEFKKINISRATKLTMKETELKCTYFSDTGSFTIEANNSLCTTGFVFPLDKGFRFMELSKSEPAEDIIELDSETLYRELHVRGYHFGKAFQNILQIRDDSSHAVIKWTDNVITYLDALLQSSVMQQPLRLLYVPTLIEAMQVDPIEMRRQMRYCAHFGTQISDVMLDHRTRVIRSAGVQVLNATFKPIARKLEENANAEVVVESYEMIPYDESDAIDVDTKETIQKYVSQVGQVITDKTPVMLSENESKSHNHGVLMLANEALNTTVSSPSMTSLGTELDCDILHCTLTSDRFFRTQLDVVIENINLYTKLNVLEINTSDQLIYPKLVKVVTRPLFGFNMNNLIYTMAHSRCDSLPDEIRASKLIQNWVDFDPHKTRIPFRDLKPQEFVIYRDPRISLNQIDTKVDYDLLLRLVETSLVPNGFLLAFLRESVHPVESNFCQHKNEMFRLQVEQFVKFAEEAGLTYVGKKSDSFSCCSLLFRKVEKVTHNDQLIEIFNDDLSWLEVLKAANRDDSITRIWIHSCEPLSGIVGLIRALAKDITRHKAKYIFYDKSIISLESALSIARKTQLLQNAFVGTCLGSYRHITFPETPQFVDKVSDFELRQIKTGDLSSFRPFVSAPLETLDLKVNSGEAHLGPDESNSSGDSLVVVDIHKAPLNFRDVMIASARMSPSDVSDHMTWDDVVLGLEFAGRVRHTDQRVMGFANSKALSSRIVAHAEMLWPVPKHWSLTQASTVPCVYATCYYGLFVRCHLQQGETVLIHAGTGGIGLAAINICLALKCRVFTTAGSEEKRAFLRRTYPQIEPDCIGNSRDTSFESMVMQQTDGKGVDVVLNSLTDQMFWASLRCLANNGRFCEIGKYQFMNDDLMDSSIFLRNKTFHGVHVDRLFPDGAYRHLLSAKAVRQRNQTWHLLQQGIESGVVQPLPYTVFDCAQVESAFRFMSTGKHIGKVVVQMVAEDAHEVRLPISVRAVPRSYFSSSKSYIIAGGLGGMGLELMFWMQERGAKQFVLTSRTGIKTGVHKYMVKLVRQLGCTVVVSAADAGHDAGARQVVAEAEALAPLGGVFLSTLVLANESIDKITEAMYRKCMYAKSTQAVVYDRVVRALPYAIDYFVGFSSIAAGRGFPGQTNYAFANSIVEKVCEGRRRDGMHGLAVQWGIIGDVGYVADNVDVKESLRGYKPQAIISCWHWMDRCMQSPHAVVGSFVKMEDNLTDVTTEKISLLDHVCNIMGIKNKTKLEPKATLADLGLDSMMATEIGNVFENEFHVALTAKDIRAMTIEKITQGFTED